MWYPGIDDKTYLNLTRPKLSRVARPCRGRDMAPPQPVKPRLFAARDTQPGANAVARTIGAIYGFIRCRLSGSRREEAPRM